MIGVCHDVFDSLFSKTRQEVVPRAKISKSFFKATNLTGCSTRGAGVLGCMLLHWLYRNDVVPLNVGRDMGESRRSSGMCHPRHGRAGRERCFTAAMSFRGT
jgi:hypothetical protein